MGRLRRRLPRLVRVALDRAPGGLPARWPRAPLLDAATAAVGAPRARARFDVDGTGASVCLVDTGVDLEHRDLRDAADRTRVRWLLDLDAAPRGVHPDLEARFGAAVWTGAELDAARAAGEPVPGDPHGHGTAVAAVAVGDDAGPGEPPGPDAGMAPGANLIVVRALRHGMPGFVDDDVALGARFCFAVGGQGPDPTDPSRTVAVLALGGHDGAHDGSEPFERALAALADAGHLIVVASGNDDGFPEHASARLATGQTVEVPLRVPAPGGAPGPRFVSVVVATDAASPVSVALRAPDGTRTRWVAPGDLDTADHGGGRLSVDGTRAPRGTSRVLYAVASGGGDVPVPLGGGAYGLALRGPGRFDAWIAGADVGPVFLPPHFDGPLADTRASVTIPATTPELIAVGATVSRASIDTDDAHLVIADAQNGQVAPFSPEGPPPNGAPKPDLLAPGGYVVTALSGDLVPDDPGNMFGGSPVRLDEARVGQGRVAVRGTSFAAPIVAGALALALEMAPAGGVRDKHLLVATARRLVDAAWSPHAAGGQLDVGALLEARMEPPGAIDPAATFQVAATRSTVAPGDPLWLVLRATSGDGRPADGMVQVALPDGTTVPAALLGGIAELPVTVPADAPAGARLAYRVASSGRSLGVATVHVEGYGTPGGGGGCDVAMATGRGAPATPLPLFGASLTVWVAQRRRRGTPRSRRRAPSPLAAGGRP